MKKEEADKLQKEKLDRETAKFRKEMGAPDEKTFTKEEEESMSEYVRKETHEMQEWEVEE